MTPTSIGRQRCTHQARWRSTKAGVGDGMLLHSNGPCAVYAKANPNSKRLLDNGAGQVS